MREFGQVQRVVHLPLAGSLDPRQSQAGGLRAGIDFEHDRLQRTLLDVAVRCRRIVNGLSRWTTARLRASMSRALLGVHGISGFLCRSSTNTIARLLSCASCEAPLPGSITVLSRPTQNAPFASVALACSAQRTDPYPDRCF